MVRNFHYNLFILQLQARKVAKIFVYSMMFKTTLRLLYTKFKILKVLGEYREILKYGTVSASFAAVFFAIRMVIQKLREYGVTWLQKLNNKVELFLVGFFASLVLNRYEPGDMNFIKIFIYPRACECVWYYIKH